MLGPETEVEVYWNNTRKLWSLRVERRVVEHRASLMLGVVVFIASEKSRLRCVRLGTRDVHAWADGLLLDGPRPPDAVRVGYRLLESGFRRRDTGKQIVTAPAAWFEADGSAWAASPMPPLAAASPDDGRNPCA